MSSRSKAKNVRKYANAPAPSMQDLVKQVSGLMQSGLKEDLRDSNPLATSQPQAPRKTLADVYRSAGSGLTLQFEDQTSPRQSGGPR